MSAISPAAALSEFLSEATPPNSGVMIERLGQTLLSAGDHGMSYPEALEASGFSRGDFLSVLSHATASGSIEKFNVDGQERLRLTPAGRSLY